MPRCFTVTFSRPSVGSRIPGPAKEPYSLWNIVSKPHMSSCPSVRRSTVSWCRFIDIGQRWRTQGEMQNFVRRTGVMPITHTVVMKKDLAEREPWIAKSLFDTFVEAQRVTDEIYQTDPKLMSLLDSVFLLEQQQAIYGSNPYVQGLAPNRKIVETFVRYAHDQGYISRRIPVEELFVPGTLAL